MNNVDFLNILTFITVFFLCVLIVDFIIKKFSQNKSIKLYNSTINFSGRKKIFNNDFIFHYAKSLFPVFFAVLIVRSFVFQPYKVPTGSLEPTVMPGDFIFVDINGEEKQLSTISTGDKGKITRILAGEHLAEEFDRHWIKEGAEVLALHRLERSEHPLMVWVKGLCHHIPEGLIKKIYVQVV